jgi:hypothetical protein
MFKDPGYEGGLAERNPPNHAYDYASLIVPTGFVSRKQQHKGKHKGDATLYLKHKGDATLYLVESLIKV